ncbi:CDC27 protein [Dispira simplex]|nr:CDC27 protein [Dispira simplex]
MMTQTDYAEILTIRLFHEHKPVTYLWLSRMLQVHVNQAKAMLYEFYNQRSTDDEPCTAVYCVSGRPLDKAQFTNTTANSATDQDNEQNEPSISPLGFAFVLTSEAQLESTKKQFHSVAGVHIWSLQHQLPEARETFVNVLIEERNEYRHVEPAEEIKARNATSGVTNATVTCAAAGGVGLDEKLDVKKKEALPQSKSPPPVPTTKRTASPTPLPSKSQPAKRAKPESTRPTNRLLSGFAKVSKKAAKEAFEPQPSEPEAAASTPGTPQDMDVDDDNQGDPPKYSVKSNRKTRARIMESDDDDGDDTEEQEEDTEDVVQGDTASQSEKDTMDDDPLALCKFAPKLNKPPRQHKVAKTTTYIDERGYMVTETKEEWVPCSDEALPSSATSPVKSEKQPPATTTTGAAKSSDRMEQPSLLSFFRKK